MAASKVNNGQVNSLLQAFAKEFQPLETHDRLFELTDSRTGARYCECHIRGSKIISLGTIDVPLDPEEQPDYRANRDIVLNSSAFQTMKEDAKQKRSFSNIVAEFTKDFDPEHPLKIIGGQHRFEASRREPHTSPGGERMHRPTSCINDGEHQARFRVWMKNGVPQSVSSTFTCFVPMIDWDRRWRKFENGDEPICVCEDAAREMGIVW